MVSFNYKWLSLPVLVLMLVSFKPVYHPLHVGVIEIENNAAEKSLEITCKIFTDDFEKILTKNYRTKVDLINPSSKAAMDSLVKKYLSAHLQIKANGRPLNFTYVGFENEREAAYGYLEVKNVGAVSRIDVSTDIMYDQFDDQTNIIHVKVGGKRKSSQLTYPEKNASVSF